MYQGIQIIFWPGLLTLLIATGCNNRPFAQSARVPAPGTYQLRIPSLASNQPYYTPDQAGAAVNPGASAPTINVANQELNGWKQTNQPMPPTSNAPVYNSPNVLAQGGGYAPPNIQVAMGSTRTTPATTTAQNPNGADSTRVDSTRLAATDATGVRPPSVRPINPQTPNRYAADIQVYQGIYPPAGNNPAGNHSIANPNNPNGFTNPNEPIRYAAQPVVGNPGTYRSPYIRNAGTFAQGTNGFGNPPMGSTTGWVARDDNGGPTR